MLTPTPAATWRNGRCYPVPVTPPLHTALHRRDASRSEGAARGTAAGGGAWRSAGDGGWRSTAGWRGAARSGQWRDGTAGRAARRGGPDSKGWRRRRVRERQHRMRLTAELGSYGDMSDPVGRCSFEFIGSYLQTVLPSLIHRSYSRTHTTALHTLYSRVALSAWGVSFASRFEHRPRSLFSFFFRSYVRAWYLRNRYSALGL